MMACLAVFSCVLGACVMVPVFSQDFSSTVSYYSINRRQEEVVFRRIFAYSELASEGYPDRLYVLFHGFGSSANSSWNLLLANALLDLGEDVMAVDYEEAVAVPYDKAVNTSLSVGNQVAEFFSTSSSPLRFVGFSLGAHVAGIASYILRVNYYIIVERIIGLDPALPLYSRLESYHRLDSEDAEFVMIVHTDGGELGYLEPMGHVDFYPNGGVNPQPQCASTLRYWVDILVQFLCSHNAAVQYMIDSAAGGLVATKCTSWEDFKNDLCAGWQRVRLGFDLPSSVRGMFFLRTRDGPPFGLPPGCSHYGEEDILAMKTSGKEANEDNVLSPLLIIITQIVSIWLIYKYYPFE